jgi:hypothetical protein
MIDFKNNSKTYSMCQQLKYADKYHYKVPLH